MAIFFKDKELSAVYYGKKAIVAIYKGARLALQGTYLTAETEKCKEIITVNK